MDQAAALSGGRGSRLHARLEQRFATGFLVDAAVDVEIAGGSILVLFGPSGAGKTTILRQIAGLERPDRGGIVFGGEVWFDSARALWQPPQARRVGVVFQEPTLFPHLTVGDNIRYGVDVAAAGEESRSGVGHEPTPVSELAILLGVGNLTDRYPRALSGGEAQRVALARALAIRPRLLLLDEPFASLDAPTRLRLRRDVRALLTTTRTPAILVTHDRTEALAMGDLAAVVIGGRIRQVGPIADVFSRPADAAVAASLGVEAVLPARVIGGSAGLIEVAVDAAVLYVAEREPIAAGSPVYACIRAEDVTLETRAPGQASTRNHLAARVVAITAEGPIDRVTLDCGFPLDALITRRSREELHLEAGAQLTAAIKATSVHLVPRV
jgi:molybdate transport system ATP-binding protein